MALPPSTSGASSTAVALRQAQGDAEQNRGVGASHPLYERLISYYEHAGPDFEEWSSGFNMHFGFFRLGLNPFRREPMLNEMNRQVLKRLRLEPSREDLIVDMGCGVGATVRYAASLYPRKRVVGVTIVPWQVEKGNGWNERVGVYPRAQLDLQDYTATGLAAASADGAYAIESSCHALGADKAAFIQEAARILKPGARLVVADGFLKTAGPLGPVYGSFRDTLCRTFVLPELANVNQFARALDQHGFEQIELEDISWRVAPSALHSPVAVLWFALKKRLRREPLSRESVDNLKGSLASTALGTNRRKIGYFLVSATRR